ncbi:hypothetical protein KI616_04910 [Hydrogenophaga taeniospiralis]|nr:hypothetical protein KI616_04910 [Hydrogenophaga taeniospiralis]
MGFVVLPVCAQVPIEVAVAGMGYAGAANTLEQRFKYSLKYEEARRAQDNPVGAALVKAVQNAAPSNLHSVQQIDSLRGRDQALVVALVIGSETVVSEQFGDLHKLLVLIRGQAMFFDFKSMNVVRSYPLSFAYVDLLNHAPSPEDVQERVKLVYEGANGKPGILDRFVSSVTAAKVPANVPRLLQVTSVTVKPEALEHIPAYIKSAPGAVDAWLADIVSEAVSSRAGIPVVPFAKGYAIGNVMSMRVSDGKVWELKLPTPDYEIAVELNGFRKVKVSEVPGGATSYVYAAYSQIRIEEPLSRKVYLDTAIKHGEPRVIPASQRYVDDFPHFYDALNGLFTRISLSMGGKGDDKWLKLAAGAKDVEQQILLTRELIEQCR